MKKKKKNREINVLRAKSHQWPREIPQILIVKAQVAGSYPSQVQSLKPWVTLAFFQPKSGCFCYLECRWFWTRTQIYVK